MASARIDKRYCCDNGKRKPAVMPAAIFFLIWLLLTGREAAAQPSANGITAPEVDTEVSGVVTVQGTAVHPNFLRYELAFRREDGAETDWIVFAEGSQPVIDGTLAVWDTTVGRDIGAPVFPDGRYRLRLRVVRADYNYDEYYVSGLEVANGEAATPAETPRPVETAAATAVFITPTPGQARPTPIPSLTPFPTLTPPPTVARPATAEATLTPPPRGVLPRLLAAPVGRIGRAFRLGIQVAVGIFLLFFAYLAARGVARRLWRAFWSRRGNDR
jgi:hypothetical protein